MIQRGALRRQKAGSRRQETPEGVAACFSNLVETHVT
jgi:hypothetical protein